MTPRFVDLFAWEWRQAGRNRLLWTILAVLCASFVWGALNTAWLHREQTAAIAHALDGAKAHEAHTRALAQAFHAPVSPGKGQVAYWQDPTNIAGYSEYFVKVLAAKPHRPASPLAAGVSDLAPSRLEIKLNTPFGFLDTYDFENPRGLALGRFDLAFAVVFLAPVALLLVLCLLGTVERDRGMLRLVASQAVDARTWVGARLAAILAWVLPAAILSLVLTMIVAGVPMSAAGAVAAAAVLLVAYLLFWSAIAFFVLARQPTAAAALSTLAAAWAILTIGAPIAIGAVLALVDPAPSPVLYVDAQRRTTDAVQSERDAIIGRAIVAQPALANPGRPLASLDHATRLSFLIPETETRLAPLRTATLAHRARQASAASLAGFVLPAVGMEDALARLAGVDAARQRAFETQARAHQLSLRARIYPLVQAQLLQPPPPATRETRGILNLDRPLELPPFVFQEPAGLSAVTRATGFAAWLAVLAAAIALLAAGRADRWRVL
jgi:ABC-2 type transport system permease protein